MYKVFVDNSCVYFKKNEKFSTNVEEKFLPYLDPKKLEYFRDSLQHYTEKSPCYISSRTPERSIREFFSKFQWIEAAGGIVKQLSTQNYLFIYRNGRWDLPKGKIESNESPESASIREVQEECGLKKIDLGKRLPASYHVYHAYNKYWIKKTYWFEMTTLEHAVTPQSEEDISKVEWMNEEKVKTLRKETYANLIDIIDSTLLRN